MHKCPAQNGSKPNTKLKAPHHHLNPHQYCNIFALSIDTGTGVSLWKKHWVKQTLVLKGRRAMRRWTLWLWKLRVNNLEPFCFWNFDLWNFEFDLCNPKFKLEGEEGDEEVKTLTLEIKIKTILKFWLLNLFYIFEIWREKRAMLGWKFDLCNLKI